MPKAAGQVLVFIFLVKIIFSPYMPRIAVMQGKCLFSDILRPEVTEQCVLLSLEKNGLLLW